MSDISINVAKREGTKRGTSMEDVGNEGTRKGGRDVTNRSIERQGSERFVISFVCLMFLLLPSFFTSGADAIALFLFTSLPQPPLEEIFASDVANICVAPRVPGCVTGGRGVAIRGRY